MKGKITNFRFAIRIATSLIHVYGKEILGYDDTALFGIYSLNASDSDNFCQFIILNTFNKNNKTCYSCFLLISYFLKFLITLGP